LAIYGFVYNDCQNRLDKLGLAWGSVAGAGVGEALDLAESLCDTAETYQGCLSCCERTADAKAVASFGGIVADVAVSMSMGPVGSLYLLASACVTGLCMYNNYHDNLDCRKSCEPLFIGPPRPPSDSDVPSFPFPQTPLL
jgi:hypothetical protein